MPPPTPARRPSCPNCGAELQPVDGYGRDTPPWGCFSCSRGWWNSELTRDARARWDPTTRTHRRTGADIAAAIRTERRDRAPGTATGDAVAAVLDGRN